MERRLHHPHPMSDFVAKALAARRVKAAYDDRPAYQRNDYIGWIMQAKREETRRKRLNQMLDELEGGTLYMGMKHKSEA